MEKETIRYSKEIPLYKDVDVVVAGAGPAGIGAAVCAAPRCPRYPACYTPDTGILPYPHTGTFFLDHDTCEPTSGNSQWPERQPPHQRDWNGYLLR